MTVAAAPLEAPDASRALPPLALYVHLPWCVRKCPYCDFNSHAWHDGADRRRYVAALLRDFDGDVDLLGDRTIESVFFGGGTPSLFSPEEIGTLLVGLRARQPIATDAEITLEANPGTVERGRFAGYRDAGITRVSLGAQSFSETALERLGRIHTPGDTVRSVEELRTAGFDNFNLDLMYALPDQTPAGALADLEAAIALEPTHLSHYQLTLEPGTVFHARPPPLPDEDAAWQMQQEGQALLAAEGYRQYEVSAYARAGMRCRHNLNYWRFGDYAGIGAGAHGKLSLASPARVLRTVKPRMPADYQRRAESGGPLGARAPVAPEALCFEFMLNALRLNEGFTDRGFEARTGLPFAQVRPRLALAEARGLIERWPPSAQDSWDDREAEGWRPTPLGQRFLNDLQALFLD